MVFAGQNIGKNSNGNIQAETVIYNDYETIEKIFYNLLEVNYPKLQREAYEKSIENIKEMLDILKEKIELNKQKIDIFLLKQPDVQFLLANSVVNAAKKGNKMSIETLCNLIMERISTSDDLYELILEDAALILPKLTKANIIVLNIMNFTKNLKIDDLKTMDELESHFKKIIETFNIENKIFCYEINYLKGLGLIERTNESYHRGFEYYGNQHDFFQFLIKFNKHLEGKPNSIIEAEIDNYDAINLIKEIYIQNDFGRLNILPVGKIISLANIKNYFDIDCKKLMGL